MANNTPKRNNRDIEELESAFQKLANKRGASRAGRYAKTRDDKIITMLIIGISVFLILAIIGGILLFNPSSNDKVISGDVNVLGINLNGMSSSDAANALNKEFYNQYSGKDITVTIEDVAVNITAAELSVKLEGDKIVESVLAGNQDLDDLTGFISMDEDTVMKKITACVPPMTAPLVPTTYTVDGTKPKAFDKIDETASMVLKITKGTPGKAMDRDTLMEMIKKAFLEKKNNISYTCPITNPEPLDFDAISKEFCTLPVDATYDTETYKVSGGTLGYLFDIEDASAKLEQAEFGEAFEISFQWKDPEHTMEELNDLLFRDTLATYTTKAGYDYNRNINLKLACEAIDGIIMNPGDTFSYNETLGERTPEKGYKPGASYVGGETVYDYGGGICQVSSTLYYCTIVSDLEIIERDCHGYASSYIPLSMDATVFWGGIDFKFRNNSEYPIRIDAKAEGSHVTVSIVGTDYKDYYVKFEYEHIDTYPFEVIYQEMKADNEKGFKDGDVITSAYTGYKSKGYRVKYDKATDQEIERILESTDVYAKRDRVICKIVEDETEPTEPVPTDPTEPPVPTDPPEPSTPTESTPTESTPESTPSESTPTEDPPVESDPPSEESPE